MGTLVEGRKVWKGWEQLVGVVLFGWQDCSSCIWPLANRADLKIPCIVVMGRGTQKHCNSTTRCWITPVFAGLV